MPIPLLLTIFLPLAAAILLLLLVRSRDGAAARWIALLGSLASLVSACVVAGRYVALPALPLDAATPPISPRIAWHTTWLEFGGDWNIRLEFFLGLDGVSLLLVLMTALLTVVSILYCWGRPRERSAEYYAMLLVLETSLLGAFCAFDLLLFYIFFEFTLIPLYFMIGLWGGPDRRRAARRFFLYTFGGSLVTLIGLVALAMSVATQTGIETPFSLPAISAALAEAPLPMALQIGLFLAISLGFAVKMPLIPFHTWQPLAYVEAPTAATVLLTGAVMKLGTYGFFRICLSLLPGAVLTVGVPLIATLSLIGVVYAGLAALAQQDLKRLVAYSSISHIGICTLGLFALNSAGLSGGVLQMINHGVTTGAIFLIIGMVYERYRTRQLTRLGGLARRLPRLTACFAFVCIAGLGLPGLNNFVGEFLSLAGMFAAHPVYAIIGTLGVIVGAWYLLLMLQRGFYGTLREPSDLGELTDLRPREALLLAPLMVLCLAIGVYPQPLLEIIEPDVRRVAQMYQDDIDPSDSGEPSVSVAENSEINRGDMLSGTTDQNNIAANAIARRGR